jgi:porphobilinogen synthase
MGPRRLRFTEGIRRLVAEVDLSPRHLVWPLFVKEEGEREEISSMPGVFRHPLKDLPALGEEALEAGLGGVILFGVLPDSEKDPLGRGAYHPEGIVQRAIRTLKRHHPDLLVIADTCLCEYTDHGHCGVVREGRMGFYVDNEASLDLLAQTALSQAEAGADVVAPSAMMDGQVRAIREALDRGGFAHVPILSYAVKYTSSFYGPFREAAASAPRFGDRAGYQMDPRGGLWDALWEAQLDDLEGADLLMVKPALPYLDVLAELKRRFSKPLAAYQVSGEYAMLKAAALAGYLDERRAVLESLYALRRAGAQVILTYYAPQASAWFRESLP